MMKKANLSSSLTSPGSGVPSPSRPPIQDSGLEPGSALHTTIAGPPSLSSGSGGPAPSCCCNVLLAYEPYSQGPDHDPAEWFRRCPVHQKDHKSFWLFIDTLEDFDDAMRSAKLTPEGRTFRRELLEMKNLVNPQHGGKP